MFNFSLVKIMLMMNMLFPIIGILLISMLKLNQMSIMKLMALNLSSFCFMGFLYLWLNFNKSIIKFQFILKVPLLLLFNLNILLGIDGISLLFLLLITFLIPICFLMSWNSIKYLVKEYLMTFLMLDFLLINTFCMLDLLLFYIFFESILMPMFMIIGIWGSRESKMLANYYFFIYTMAASILLLVAMLYIFDQTGTTDYFMGILFSFSKMEQMLLWFLFFISFSSKIPMLPVHLWLPEAHVEAPTVGSIILAGVLLKLGVYGFIRFSIVIFPMGAFYFTPLVYSLATIGIIYTSLTAMSQSDLKKMMAYTSISHMNLVVLGIYSYNIIGMQGAIYQSVNHGFISSGLFMLIGIIYDSHKTRMLNYYGGLSSITPLFTFMFLFFSFANMGFPCTGNFLGELLMFMGLFKLNMMMTLFSSLSLVISAIYSLWLFNRMSFGNLKIQYLTNFLDLNMSEFSTLIPLIISSLISGIYSNILLSLMNYNMTYLIEFVYY